MTKKEQSECLHCGHTWTPRLKHKPLSCPKCKSYNYEYEKVIPKAKEVEDDPNSTVGKPWGAPEPEERW